MLRACRGYDTTDISIFRNFLIFFLFFRFYIVSLFSFLVIINSVSILREGVDVRHASCFSTRESVAWKARETKEFFSVVCRQRVSKTRQLELYILYISASFMSRVIF